MYPNILIVGICFFLLKYFLCSWSSISNSVNFEYEKFISLFGIMSSNYSARHPKSLVLAGLCYRSGSTSCRYKQLAISKYPVQHFIMKPEGNMRQDFN